MRILITGIGGFVGRFLAAELVQAGHEVVGMDISLAHCPGEAADAREADLTDGDAVDTAIASLCSDACVHLGGIASPPVGRTHPERMLNTNILGTTHVLDALRRTAPEARMLLASTAYIYDNIPQDEPITEESPIRPTGVYAVSKAAADLMTLAYAQRYDVAAMCARAANHTGAGQSTDFVVPAFARQVKAVRDGEQPPVMRVGNLESERSFLDVRDVVRAYRLIIEHGQPGQAYNVASSERVTIGKILELLCAAAGIDPEINVDPELYRPTDRSPEISIRRIRETTGWEPGIPFEKTLADVLASA